MARSSATWTHHDAVQRREISERMRGNTNGRGNLGGRRTLEQRQRMSEARKAESERRNPSLSYTAVHKRLRRDRGTPRLCEHCGTTTAKKFEWAYAGPGHESSRAAYSTDLTDYIRLCTSCHIAFDGHPKKKGGDASVSL